MVSKFTVFGSCTCRDVFYSGLNKNYKDFFEIGPTGIRLSFISIMQEPVEYEEKDIEIFPKTPKNINFTIWIKKDFEKTFLKDLKNENFEYLLMDTYYDTNFGIVDIGNNRYVTNNIRLDETAFYENLEYKKVLTIYDNTEEYFEIWKRHCDMFFEFLKENCPKTRIILNPSRHVYRKLSEDGTIIESDRFKRECDKFNKFRDLLDEYIIRNFDVDVLYFDEDTVASENHFWGCSSLHYAPQYFEGINDQLNLIIEREKINDDKANEELRKEKRERLLDIIKKRNEERRRIAAKNKQKQRLRKVKNKIHENRRRHRKELIEDSTKRVEIEKHDNIENVEPMQKEELDKKETETQTK